MLATFPNPFTEKNNIEFEIAEDADVILSIYNTDGKLIEEMFRGRVDAKQLYRFEFDAVNLPTGVDVYKLVTPKDVFVERVVLTRQQQAVQAIKPPDLLVGGFFIAYFFLIMIALIINLVSLIQQTETGA